jgi:hypothetical protein
MPGAERQVCAAVVDQEVPSASRMPAATSSSPTRTVIPPAVLCTMNPRPSPKRQAIVRCRPGRSRRAGRARPEGDAVRAEDLLAVCWSACGASEQTPHNPPVVGSSRTRPAEVCRTDPLRVVKIARSTSPVASRSGAEDPDLAGRLWTASERLTWVSALDFGLARSSLTPNQP